MGSDTSSRTETVSGTVSETRKKHIYDYIIVGAGIAGLHTGIRLSKKYPNAKIAILERFGYTGGRVVTYKHGQNKWENGAGRIHRDAHTLVMKYMRRYSLTFSPIAADVDFENPGQTNIFESTYIPIIQTILENLPATELATHTIKELLTEIIGEQKTSELLGAFAYNSEVDTLRADLALKSFRGEMGTHAGYGVCKEGLSSLIDGMVRDFRGGGSGSRGEILERHWVKNVNPDTLELDVLVGPKDDRREELFVARKGIILALHFDALCEIKSIQGWHMLSKVRMRPLLRVYATFKGAPFKGAPFRGLSSIVYPGSSGNGIRYFIPMGENVAMISYTDGGYAEKYMKILERDGEVALRDRILSELRVVLPDRDVSSPTFFKTHPWKSGCTYWLPGEYDVNEASVEAHIPFRGKKVYICGESFSTRQAWMEGALEHAESLLKNVDI